MKKLFMILSGTLLSFGAIAVIVLNAGLFGKGNNSGFKYQEAMDAGDLLMDAQMYEEAIKCFELAVKLNPTDANAYVSIARAHMDNGAADEAAETLVIAWDRAEYSVILDSHYERLIMMYPEYEEKFANGEYDTETSVSDEEFEDKFHQNEYEIKDGKGNFADKESEEKLKIALQNANGGGLFGNAGNGANGNGGSGNGGSGNGGSGNGGNDGSGNGSGEGGFSGLTGFIGDMIGASDVFGINMKITPEEVVVYGKSVTEWTYSSFKDYILSRCVTPEEWYGDGMQGEEGQYLMVDGDITIAWVYIGPDRAGSGEEVVDITMQGNGAYYSCRRRHENASNKDYLVFYLIAGYDLPEEAGALPAETVVSGKYGSLLGTPTDAAMNSLYDGLKELLQENQGTVYAENGSITHRCEGREEIALGRMDGTVTFIPVGGKIGEINVHIEQ